MIRVEFKFIYKRPVATSDAALDTIKTKLIQKFGDFNNQLDTAGNPICQTSACTGLEVNVTRGNNYEVNVQFVYNGAP